MFSFMERDSGVLDAAPGAMEVRMVTVDGGWRGQGVATALLNATRLAAKDASCPYVKLYCTSNHSSRLVAKLGWTLLYSLNYAEYVQRNPRCGMQLPKEPHTHCRIYVDDVASAVKVKGSDEVVFTNGYSSYVIDRMSAQLMLSSAV